ncbi:hypothetical protein [Jeongeupia sp. USM3]|uniref:hypothetical protein n=1 Tax=Jeongeupia sp. USM3 TaxID=1906741 RepID=UPI00089DEBF7|nr:hypothetical protein [Jeongeupia sp. USM3]AOY00085.1 hypothetical protein BJP62_06255 [Jeongeupia sp. USM3]
MRALLLVLLLTGCASTPAPVRVPVAVSCLGRDPEPPVYRYGIGDYPGATEAARFLAADLIEAQRYISDLRRQMAGCR